MDNQRLEDALTALYEPKNQETKRDLRLKLAKAEGERDAYKQQLERLTSVLASSLGAKQAEPVAGSKVFIDDAQYLRDKLVNAGAKPASEPVTVNENQDLEPEQVADPAVAVDVQSERFQKKLQCLAKRFDPPTRNKMARAAFTGLDERLRSGAKVALEAQRAIESGEAKPLERRQSYYESFVKPYAEMEVPASTELKAIEGNGAVDVGDVLAYFSRKTGVLPPKEEEPQEPFDISDEDCGVSPSVRLEIEQLIRNSQKMDSDPAFVGAKSMKVVSSFEDGSNRWHFGVLIQPSNKVVDLVLDLVHSVH